MLPQPIFQSNPNSTLRLIQEKTIERYHQDMVYQQNINDAYLSLKMIEQNRAIPDYRLNQISQKKSLLFDAKVLTMPDVLDITSVTDGLDSVLGKLDQLAKNSGASNTKLAGAYQRIQQNIPRLLNKLKKVHHIEEENPVPTPRASQSYLMMVYPAFLMNKGIFFGGRKKMTAKKAALEPSLLSQLIQNVMEQTGEASNLAYDFVKDVIGGQKIISPTQGSLLIKEMDKGLLTLKGEQLPIEWQVALEQNTDQAIDLLVSGKTQEIGKLLDGNMYDMTMKDNLAVNRAMQMGR